MAGHENAPCSSNRPQASSGCRQSFRLLQYLNPPNTESPKAKPQEDAQATAELRALKQEWRLRIGELKDFVLFSLGFLGMAWGTYTGV